MARRNSTAVPSTMTFHVNERRRRWVRNCSRRLTRGADGLYLLGWTEVRLLKASSQLTHMTQHILAAENYNMGIFERRMPGRRISGNLINNGPFSAFEPCHQGEPTMYARI